MNKSTTYKITEHETGKTYIVRESVPDNRPIPKPEAEPIDYNKEVERLYKKWFPINDNNNDNNRDKQLERDALQWKQYYKDNQGKIPDEFPKTIFDNARKNSDVQK